MPNGRDVTHLDKGKVHPNDGIKEDDPALVKLFGDTHLFGNDVESFTRFMRSTKVPPRDAELAKSPDAIAGEALFRDDQALGCAICHRPEYRTPAAGTKILTLDLRRGSDLETVPEALGGKVIRPYSDFLLHDIGTGDGIAQTQHANLPGRYQHNLEKIPDGIRTEKYLGRVSAENGPNGRRVLMTTEGVDQRTANKMRTAPLWGLRVRPQLMHDGLSLTIEDAIRRHGGQAEGVRLKYESLPPKKQKQVLAFLKSL
jgi:CxxC motif-containing protein (DUF1111 family)